MAGINATREVLKDQLALAADTIIALRKIDADRTAANLYLQRRVELMRRPFHVRAWLAYKNYRAIFGVWDSITSTVALLRLNRGLK